MAPRFPLDPGSWPPDPWTCIQPLGGLSCSWTWIITKPHGDDCRIWIGLPLWANGGTALLKFTLQAKEGTNHWLIVMYPLSFCSKIFPLKQTEAALPHIFSLSMWLNSEIKKSKCLHQLLTPFYSLLSLATDKVNVLHIRTLSNNYKTDFPQMWQKDGTWAKKDACQYWHRSGQTNIHKHAE